MYAASAHFRVISLQINRIFQLTRIRSANAYYFVRTQELLMRWSEFAAFGSGM